MHRPAVFTRVAPLDLVEKWLFQRVRYIISLYRNISLIVIDFYYYYYLPNKSNQNASENQTAFFSWRLPSARLHQSRELIR